MSLTRCCPKNFIVAFVKDTVVSPCTEGRAKNNMSIPCAWFASVCSNATCILQVNHQYTTYAARSPFASITPANCTRPGESSNAHGHSNGSSLYWEFFIMVFKSKIKLFAMLLEPNWFFRHDWKSKIEIVRYLSCSVFTVIFESNIDFRVQLGFIQGRCKVLGVNSGSWWWFEVASGSFWSWCLLVSFKSSKMDKGKRCDFTHSNVHTSQSIRPDGSRHLNQWGWTCHCSQATLEIDIPSSSKEKELQTLFVAPWLQGPAMQVKWIIHNVP